MLDNVPYGPNGYVMQEDSYAMENEYHHNNQYGSMQMMPPPPPPPPPQYSKQFMPISSGTHGAYSDGGWNAKGKYQSGWSSPNIHQSGWPSNTGHYGGGHASGGGGGGGTYPGMSGGPMMPPPGRMSPNHMMMNDSEYSTNYHANSGRVRMPSYGFHSESYDDFATGGGRQKVEWKHL